MDPTDGLAGGGYEVVGDARRYARGRVTAKPLTVISQAQHTHRISTPTWLMLTIFHDIERGGSAGGG